jgi:hypothetical protein
MPGVNRSKMGLDAVALILGALTFATGCDQVAAKLGKNRAPAASATVNAVPDIVAPSGAAPPSAPSATSGGSCVLDPPAGAVATISAKASDLRIGASGKRALVSWVEPFGEMAGQRMPSRMFDADTRALSAERVLDSSEMGDMIPSGVVPIELAGTLASVACLDSAPTGTLYCSNVPLEEKAKPTSLFSLEFGNGGPQAPGIAAVAGDKADELAIFLPEGGGGDVAMFVPAVASRRKTHTFKMHTLDVSAHAEALTATRSAPGQATVVFRYKGAIRARHAGFDEKWRGKAVTLSEAGALVGAPVVTTLRSDVVALFSSRPTTSAPWAITRAVLNADSITRTPLATGAEQAQAPGIIADDHAGCAIVSWVEGQGKTTRTRLARSCDGQLDPSKAITISRPAIEGGRAYLARSGASTFVAWEELPKGTRELHVARITCR